MNQEMTTWTLMNRSKTAHSVIQTGLLDLWQSTTRNYCHCGGLKAAICWSYLKRVFFFRFFFKSTTKWDSGFPARTQCPPLAWYRTVWRWSPAQHSVVRTQLPASSSALYSSSFPPLQVSSSLIGMTEDNVVTSCVQWAVNWGRCVRGRQECILFYRTMNLKKRKKN